MSGRSFISFTDFRNAAVVFLRYITAGLRCEQLMVMPSQPHQFAMRALFRYGAVFENDDL